MSAALVIALLFAQPAPVPEPVPLDGWASEAECIATCEGDDEDRAPLSEAECEALCTGDEP